MVPIVEGWATTSENPLVTGKREQARHFGQPGHVRFYGADFRRRVEAAGFTVDEFTATAR